MVETKARPFLKWVGGKRQLLPQLMEHLPKQFGSYHEPFLGGGALFFHLRSIGRMNHAQLSDTNSRLVRAYRGVRTDVESVIRQLREYERQHSLSFYKCVRTEPVHSFSEPAAAAWMIYLNRTCFNGLYRVNRENGFNVPMGDYKNPRICDPDGLRECSVAMNNTAITQQRFSEVLFTARPGDLVYFDPPYVPLSATSSFTSYTADGFGHADQVDLRDVATELTKRGVHVVLSNSSAPVVRDLYAGWTLHEVSARRNVSCKGNGRGAVKELIITPGTGVGRRVKHA